MACALHWHAVIVQSIQAYATTVLAQSLTTTSSLKNDQFPNQMNEWQV